MRLKTVAAVAMAAITAALGLSVITASPAAAAEVLVGTWRSYDNNPINGDIVIGDWEWHCGRSGVGATSWSVCFGDTFPFAEKAFTHGGANGHDLHLSPSL
jgi:hypothetical protein